MIGCVECFDQINEEYVCVLLVFFPELQRCACNKEGVNGASSRLAAKLFFYLAFAWVMSIIITTAIKRFRLACSSAISNWLIKARLFRQPVSVS